MPRTKRAQRFLFDPDKFYHDPAVQKMSLPARGAHAMLVCASWHQKVPGVFVADDRILASLAMCTHDEWRQVKDEVEKAFTVTRDTWELSGVTQVKIEQDKKRDAWVNRKQRQRLRERDMAVTSRVGSGSGSGAGTGEKKEPTPTPPLRARRVPVLTLSEPNQPPPPGVEPETWKAWFVHRLAIRKPLNELSAKMCHKELSRFYEDGHDPDQIIQTAIASGWRGLFVPNHELNGRNGNGSQRR